MKHVKTSHWIVNCIIFFCIFVSFFYIDLSSLTIWTTNIWDCIFGEGIQNYYLYSAMNLAGVEHSIVGNDLLIYFPWAIWNLPIWLISRATGISISTNVYMLFYSKLFLVFVFTGVLFITNEICKELKIGDEKNTWVIYLTTSSAFLFTSIAYAGQNDILPIFFFLIGLLYLLRKKQYYFLFFAAISIAMKPYMMFSTIVLILLIEKKPWRVLAKLASVFSIYIIQKIILSAFPYYNEAMNSGAADGEVAQLLHARLSIAQYDVSVLVILLGAIAIFAYFKKTSEEEFNKYVIFYATAPLLLIFLAAGYSFYRPMYLIPLLYILFLMNKNVPLYFQLLLEVGLVGAMYYQFLRVEALFYNPYYINDGLVGRLLNIDVTRGNSFAELMMRIAPSFPYYFAISSAVLIVVIVLILCINYPGFSYKLPLEAWENMKCMPYIRLAIYVIFVVMALCGLVI